MTIDQQHYNWIQNIIDSCNNDFHFDGVDKLIELYEQRHNNASLTMCLLHQRTQRWNSIHSILT